MKAFGKILIHGRVWSRNSAGWLGLEVKGDSQSIYPASRPREETEWGVDLIFEAFDSRSCSALDVYRFPSL